MTPDERNLLDQFLSDLARSRPAAKDAEAAQRIESALRGNPDGAYVLVQHAILSDQALYAAQQRIAELEAGQGGAQGGGFLGGAFGRDAPNPPGVGGGLFGQRAGSAVPPTGGGLNPPWGGGAQQGPFSGGGGIGNFLRSAGTTAAGVAGGAFLFEGLSNMFGGHHGGGYGFGGFGGGDNVTINEFSGGGDYDNGDGGGFDDN